MRRFLAFEKGRLDLADTFDVDGAALLEPVLFLEAPISGLVDLDAPGLAVRLHAARKVDRVAPEIKGRLLRADHAADDLACADADAHRDRVVVRLRVVLDLIQQLER